MVGLPIVASAFPEIREVLDQLPVGRAFDPEDPSSIAAAVNAFFRTRAQNKQAIEAGLNRARQQFTWEQESRKLLKVFEEAVG